MKKRIKIQGILIASSILTIFVLYKYVLPQWKDEELDEFLDIIGMGFILLGFLLRISARGIKEEKSSGGHRLVKNGPYLLIRNPMYFGTLLIGTGFIIALVKWWALLLFLLVCGLIYIPQIKKEEAVLSKQFGQEYKDYCMVTPKYFPKIVSAATLRKCLPLKLSWLKKELISFISALVILFVIEIWEDVALFGYNELFKEGLELTLTLVLFSLLFLFFYTFKE